jgi:hypothetical protein
MAIQSPTDQPSRRSRQQHAPLTPEARHPPVPALQ